VIDMQQFQNERHKQHTHKQHTHTHSILKKYNCKIYLGSGMKFWI